MTQPWIDLTIGTETDSHLWSGPRLSVGGPGCDVTVPEPAGGELHLWSSPPKVVRVGKGPSPLLNGKAVDDAALANGDTLQWGGAVLVFRQPEPQLEELPEPAAAKPKGAKPSGSAAGGGSGASGGAAAGGRAWRRVLAGILVEQKLADKAATKRWQDAVIRGEFKADAAAEDLIAASSAQLENPKVLERAGRLERDLVMMPLQSGVRGASRGARRAVRGGSAFLVANLLALTAYTLVIVSIAFLLRAQKGTSFDGIIDSVLESLGSLFGG